MSRRRKDIISLVGIIGVAILGLVYTFWAGNKPLLGLDLQGGVSVVLTPKGEVDEERLQQAIAIIRQRVDAIGVAEPEISRQGNSVLIQIPGVKDTDRALALVGQTAELRFRPVLAVLPPEPTDTTGSTIPGSTVPGSSVPGSSVPADPSAASVTSTSVDPAAVTPASPTTSQGAAPLGGVAPGEGAAGGQVTPSTVSELAQAPSTSSTLSPELQQQLQQAQQQAALQQQAQAFSQPTTTADQDDPTKTVILPEYETDAEGRPTTVKVRYQLGPAELTGTALEDASAGVNQQGQWVVRPRFKPGADGIDLFNKAAAACYAGAATCPTKQLGMTLDGKVISAPTIQAASFQPDQIQISGSFTEKTAKELATQLRYGALPVELEPQQVQLVSATLGEDALHAGIVAGLVALVLVAVYMIAWYRILGALAIFKLAIEGALLWTFISFMGQTQGLALTLAGVTGIIVSIGVSLDSNVVYYEHLKEDVRNGRTIRSAVDKSFTAAFSTIIKADGTSAIGAFLLYWLSVGPVRGFAFYLGISTILDLFASYFYMRPVVSLVGRSKSCEEHPKRYGLPAGPSEGATGGEPRGRRREKAAVAAEPTTSGAVT
ncbi:MAG: protein translocase subunit SecD [Acidimicrobiales bacterium]